MSTVLVVEPSEFVRDQLRVLFKQKGIPFIEAISGKDALEKAGKTFPDTVFMDLALLDIDPTVVILGLKKINPQTRIIITSENMNKQQAGLAIQAGVKEFLLKPYRLEAIMEKLAS